ncbi:MAG: DNA-3-methyladenine glycosylase [Bacteroidia bacterium]|jgi:DNA-3-methyladenine glycosylase
MQRVLNKAFFDRPTLDVARDLLGKQLCRRLDSGKIIRARICETEAYDGFEDRASHASKGATTRNVVMFGPPGRAYIYLCYGVHWLFNITTREKGYPAAVLIRAVEGVAGPGRLTKHFQISSSFNDQLLTRVGGLWVEDVDAGVSPTRIVATSRVGVDYAGAEWAAMPWRFVWEKQE